MCLKNKNWFTITNTSFLISLLLINKEYNMCAMKYYYKHSTKSVATDVHRASRISTTAVLDDAMTVDSISADLIEQARLRGRMEWLRVCTPACLTIWNKFLLMIKSLMIRYLMYRHAMMAVLTDYNIEVIISILYRKNIIKCESHLKVFRL